MQTCIGVSFFRACQLVHVLLHENRTFLFALHLCFAYWRGLHVLRTHWLAKNIVRPHVPYFSQNPYLSMYARANLTNVTLMQINSGNKTIHHSFFGFIFSALMLACGTTHAACTPDPDVVKLHPGLASSECTLVDTKTFGNVSIRTYQDTQMPAASAKIFRAAIAEAGVKSMAAFSKLKPGIEYHAVEFIISPKVEIGGLAGVPKAMGVSNSDTCVISVNGDVNTLKMEGSGKASDFPALFGETFKNTIAHEIGHCFQDWNYPDQTKVSSASWWREGTVMYLAGTLYPFATPNQTKMVNEFDKLSATTPLTKLQYQNYVFFSWLGQKRGAKAMFEFMAAMPKADGEMEQRKALLAYMPAEELQQFAYDYVDGKIKGPKMDVIGKPDLGQMQSISGTVQKKFTGKAFTIMRGQFTIKDGDYDVTTTSSAKPAPAYSRTAFVWSEMDKHVETSCSSPPVYQYAAFVTGNKDVTDTMKTKLLKSNKECKACTDLGQRDKCLIGRWIMDDESLASFLHIALDKTASPTVSGDAIFEFLDNGQMKITMKELKIVATNAESKSTVIGNGIQTGTWSSNPGVFRSCPVTNTVMLDTTVQILKPIKFSTHVKIPGQAETTDFQFQCKGKTMTLSHPDAKMNGKLVIWHLSREAN